MNQWVISEDKMSQHKHAEVIHAYAEGYTVQKLATLCCDKSIRHWEDIDNPMFLKDQQYRIKPYNELWEEDND